MKELTVKTDVPDLVVVTYCGTKEELESAGVAKGRAFPHAMNHTTYGRPTEPEGLFGMWIMKRKRGGLYELRIWKRQHRKRLPAATRKARDPAATRFMRSIHDLIRGTLTLRDDYYEPDDADETENEDD